MGEVFSIGDVDRLIWVVPEDGLFPREKGVFYRFFRLKYA
jgi:hypothetical protein